MHVCAVINIEQDDDFLNFFVSRMSQENTIGSTLSMLYLP